MPTTMSAEAAARMRAPWEAGDFGAISRTFGIPAASAFAAWLDAGGDDEVLDVACGTGSVAVPLARRGVKVTALDISPRLLGEAKAAAMEAGVEIAFDEGQVEAMPYTDASFDLAISMFGVMFSSEPVAAVSELARVLRPGGRLRLASWTPEGFSGRFPAIVEPFVPPPPLGAPSAAAWGDETSIRWMLESHFVEIATERVAIEWRVDMPPVDAARFFMANAGQFVLLSSAVDPDRFAELRRRMERMWIDADRSRASDQTVIPNEYLRVTAVLR